MNDIMNDESIWFAMPLTRGQISFIKLIAKFHIDLSHNERAKEKSRRLLHCLERWPRPISRKAIPQDWIDDKADWPCGEH